MISDFSASIHSLLLLAQRDIVVDCRLHLSVQNFFHLSFGKPSVETKRDDKHQGKYENDTYDMSHGISIIVIYDTNFKLMTNIFSIQDLSTSWWWGIESSADGVEHCLSFNLASVCWIIYDDGWEQTCSIISPIFDVIIYQRISGAHLMPLWFILSWKTIANTWFSCLPIEAFYLFVADLRALLIDYITTSWMNFFDVVPELLAMTIFFITLLVNAHLS